MKKLFTLCLMAMGLATTAQTQSRIRCGNE